MAGALIQKIEEDFLSCCICFEELRDPVGLPCLHGFCFECLDDWFSASPDKTKVVCPVCKTSAAVPEEGIRGFPGHFLIKNLKETFQMNRMAEQAEDVMCLPCGEKPATMHCMDCKKSLCQQCHKSHNTFITDHKVVTIDELQSGQATYEGRHCEVHGEQVRYYCETEQKQVCVDCVSLKTCPAEHDRITLKEAAKKHASSIEDLIRRCTDTKGKFQNALKEAKMVLDDLTESKKQTLSELDKIEKDYTQRMKQVIKKQRDKVNELEQERVKEIENKLKIFQLGIDEIDVTCDQGSAVIKSRSEHLITHKCFSLSQKLLTLSESQPVEVKNELGYVKFEPKPLKIPCIGHLLQTKKWELCGQFETKGLNNPAAVAINDDGDIVVGSRDKGVKVYTRNGEVKCTLYSNAASKVAFTPDKRYIIGPYNKYTIEFYNREGKMLSSITTTDVENRSSLIRSVAVGKDGTIVAGLLNNTISIHHADGSLISKFATQPTPYFLAITSNNEIVSTSFDLQLQHGTSLQLMDYSGGNVKIIRPPSQVKIWSPERVCCGHGEIFVANGDGGDPSGIYRYTSEGVYLGCVTKEVSYPFSIAVSHDGLELYVAEHKGNVKIFHI